MTKVRFLDQGIEIEVPLGTIARDEETGLVEAEILEDGQEVIFMRGGKGGLGNAKAQRGL